MTVGAHPGGAGAAEVVLALRGVRVVRDERVLLEIDDWIVREGERWVVLGANGSGKTTLVRVAALRLHPSAGDVEVLGERLGHTDVRALRTRVGFTSAAMADLLRPDLSPVDIVMTARHGALEPWWHRYDATDRERAIEALAAVGCADLADRRFATLSSGERQRVLLARCLADDPGLLLLDEPNAGLDLGGREQLVAILGGLAADPSVPPIVLVTHHLEEIPPGFTHALLLRDGTVVASGPLAEVLSDASLSTTFDLPVQVTRAGERWHAVVGR